MVIKKINLFVSGHKTAFMLLIILQKQFSHISIWDVLYKKNILLCMTVYLPEFQGKEDYSTVRNVCIGEPFLDSIMGWQKPLLLP